MAEHGFFVIYLDKLAINDIDFDIEKYNDIEYKNDLDLCDTEEEITYYIKKEKNYWSVYLTKLNSSKNQKELIDNLLDLVSEKCNRYCINFLDNSNLLMISYGVNILQQYFMEELWGSNPNAIKFYRT